MKRSRLTALVLSLALVGTIPVAALAQAIQPLPPEPARVTPPPAPHRVDRYAVGAAAANVLWVPAKVAWCGISAGTGALAFMFSLGALAGWTESALEEGCVHKWLLTGDDFRPAPASAYAAYGQ